MSRDKYNQGESKNRKRYSKYNNNTHSKTQHPKKFEDYIIVLDYLPRGHVESRTRSFKSEPIIQAIGTNYFTILELVPRKSHINKIKIKDKYYIGSGQREIIDHIKGRISHNELTANAKFELEDTISKIIKDNEERYVNFFSNSKPITTRMHQLELLPGIGKKIMWEIINERKKSRFDSFKDISARISKIPDPEIMILKRVLTELENEDKYYIFIRPPFEK